MLSDHADWPGLVQAIRESAATRVFVTHGYVPVMVRWLQEQGWDAQPMESEYGGEQDDGAETSDTPETITPGAAQD